MLDEPVEAGVADAVRCVGPAGVVFELFHGMGTVVRDAPNDAPGARPHRFEHATLTVNDLDTLERFFVEMLGFARSDRVPGAISWLRCSGRHHHVNLMAGADAFHHMAWEVDGLADVGRLADLLAQRDESLLWGPGPSRAGERVLRLFRGRLRRDQRAVCRGRVVAPYYAPKTWPNAPSTANRWGPQPPADFLARGVPIRQVR
jgi:catechol 2,3-dioxygenase